MMALLSMPVIHTDAWARVALPWAHAASNSATQRYCRPLISAV